MKRLGFRRMLRPLRGVMMRYVPFMITCLQFENFIIEYFEGNLPKLQKFEFELHIKTCPECREYLAAYKRAVEVSGKTAQGAKHDDELPDVPEGLITAILSARKLS